MELAAAFFEFAVGASLEVATAHRDAAILSDGVGALGVAVLTGTFGLVVVGRFMTTLVGFVVLVEEALFLVAIVFLSFLLEVFLERLVILLEWFVPFLEGRAFLSKVLADAIEVGVVLLLVGALLVKFATFLTELVILAAEKFVLAELARDASVVEVDLERRLEADEVEGSTFLAAAGAWVGVGECSVGVIARNDPSFGTLEVFLQHACHHAVEGGDIGEEALAIGGIHHDDAAEGLLAFGQ